ncbi:hypothetical protein AWM70_09650 [Paenibacillus yonginensis]|uniref:Cell wall elongation regulator TseB-like domain-containing protein n=1 Tax=Paenibacillus yonginensis TaxID=1462996 RepID=A0A1B1N072_9BACL|nr:DUF5590 domain-containing protein [Paenibacillus yonginensis]ANS74824.1 hypothetical protein AWM70_09650 [Paenibacillus yonginensis]
MRTKTKWIWISILVLAAILFGLYRYYVYVMQDTWTQEDAAILRAKQEAGLVKTIGVTKSVWDDVCWVVEGNNASGEHIMVWLQDGQPPHTEQVTGASTKKAMQAKIKALMPNADVKRLVPGIYNGQYVWQLYYKEQDHYYYRFFSFSNGEALTEEFTLPNR